MSDKIEALRDELEHWAIAASKAYRAGAMASTETRAMIGLGALLDAARKEEQ